MSRILAIILLALLPLLAQAEETQIKIIGSTTFSESDILAKVGNRLDHITLHPATRWRAADAAFLVEQELQESGFNDVLVKWKILGERSIRLRVEEGSRDLLGDVVVDDVPNPKLNGVLVDLFSLKPKKRAAGLATSNYPLNDEDVEAGINLMEQQMKSIGFYDAKITVKSRVENPETGKIDFSFNVDAGKISMIAPPSFEGEQIDGLLGVTDDLVGLPATGPNLNAVRSRVVSKLSESGFLNAKVRMQLKFEPLKVRPIISIAVGQRYRLRSINYTGLEKTDPNRISARLEPLKGGILDGPLAQERIGQIISTGAFESVRTDFKQNENGTVDATLHFQEGRARGISLTGGFDTFEGVIVGASYYDRNFRGGLRNFSAGFELTQRALLGEISLTDPWLWGRDLQGTLRIFALSKDYEGFTGQRSGIGGIITQEITDHYSLEYGVGVAYVSNSPDGLLPASLGDDSYINASFQMNQLLDYRDNPALPTSGWHLGLPLEIGAVLGGHSSMYVKMQLEGSWHYQLSEKSQFSIGARGGVIIPNGGTNQLPIDLRYFLGGASSVRSFRERELGPWSTTGYATGGEAYWVTNIEYVRALAGPLRAVAFLDAGGLSRNWEDFGMTDPEVAIGLGLRLNLPIGPVRLEYGHNLTQDGRDPSGSWHFAIGATF